MKRSASAADALPRAVRREPRQEELEYLASIEEREREPDERVVTDRSAARAAARDYSLAFVEAGQRPQNFVRDHEYPARFDGMQRLRRLIELKNERVRQRNVPGYRLRLSPVTPDRLYHAMGGTLFDVIVVDPPMEEYHRRSQQGEPVMVSNTGPAPFMSWDDLAALPVGHLAAPLACVFLWVGSAEGLEAGRRCLREWGFRRCEDIVWLKTNVGGQPTVHREPRGAFLHTTEHCLVGVRGVANRGDLASFFHPNCDIDVIVAEEPSPGDTSKPVEIFEIAERFCLGRRRLHLFGDDKSSREGWLTVGPRVSQTTFVPSLYATHFINQHGLDYLVRSTPEIESLRPRSPPPPP